MQRCLILCNQCKEERTVHPSIVGAIPHEWFLLKQGGHIVMPDMHFCTIECLMQWAVEEKNKIDNEQSDNATIKAIAGEHLYETNAVYIADDGLAYRARGAEER